MYGITGAGDGISAGQPLQAGHADRHQHGVVQYEPGNPPYNTDWNNFAPSVGGMAAERRNRVHVSSSARTRCSAAATRSASTGWARLHRQLRRNTGRTRTGTRTARRARRPRLRRLAGPAARDGPAVPSAAPAPLANFRFTPAINETIDIHYPDWPVPHPPVPAGGQRELGKRLGPRSPLRRQHRRAAGRPGT